MTRLLLPLLVACATPERAPTITQPTPAPWTRPDASFPVDHAWLAQRPALVDLSRFAQRLDADPAARPGPGGRADLGFGNGRAFAMAALDGPVNGLHAMVGPRYRKDEKTYGDVVFGLERDGAALAFGTEGIGRPRRTGAVVTWAEADGATLWTVDVAPPDTTRLVRHLLVRAEADGTLALTLEAIDPLGVVAGLPTLLHPDGRRAGLWTDPPGTIDDDGRWRLPLGSVRAGDELVVPLAIVHAVDDAALAEAVEGLDATRLDDDVDAALARDAAYAAKGLQLSVDDPWLTDWLDGLVFALQTQVSPAGGVTPMSRYTSTWLRDTIGPARFWSRTGRVDEALAAVTYLELCHRARGDIGNACISGLLPDEVPQTVDWDALGPMTGRTAAEGPSHVVLSAWEVWRWSDDPATREALADRWPWMRRALLDQTLTPEGFQPWSGDETFRLAMNVVLDQALEVPWQDLAWSSNSGLLYVGAARAAATMAPSLGAPDDVPTIEAAGALARTGLEAFVRPEGHLAALILRDPAEPPVDLPFEDATLAGLWSGALDPDDPFALDTLDGLLRVAGRADGLVASPPGPTYAAGTLSGGVLTGMLPGYALWALAATGHPEHPGAFGRLLDTTSPSGQYPEGLLGSTFEAFQPLYDRNGLLGDAVARYRPWEGGIVADAAVAWILGAEPIDGGLRLRPRVPNGLDRLDASPITAPGVTASLTLAWDDGWVATVTNDGDAAFTLALELPLGVWDDVEVALDGAGELTTLPLGERLVRFEPVPVAPGETATFAVRPTP